MKPMDSIDYLFITTGTAISIVNLEQILGVIILALQIIWLLTKFVIKVVEYVKSKKELNELDGEFENITDKIGDISDVVKSEGGEHNGQSNITK